jgi:hypothetical protein
VRRSWRQGQRLASPNVWLPCRFARCAPFDRADLACRLWPALIKEATILPFTPDMPLDESRKLK